MSATTGGSTRAGGSHSGSCFLHDDDDETQGDERQSGYRPASRGGEATLNQPNTQSRASKYDSSGRIVLYISNYGLLSPTGDVRRATTGIFQGSLDPTGVNWDSIPPTKKEFYWTEFQNYCSLGKLNTAAVKKLWAKQASVAYSDLVCRVKREITQKGNTPDFVLDDVKAAWTAFWETPEAKAKSEQAKRNRNSEPGGPGTGKKVHFGGSRNSEQIAGDLAELGNIPVGFVSFRLAKKLHFKNGVYTSRKAQNIIEEVERLIEEARRPIPGTTEPRRVTAEMENAFYGKVVKLDAKGRLFGQGCMSHGIRDSSSSSGSSQSQVPVSDPRYSELESRLDHFEQTLIPRLDLMQKTLEKYVHIGRILESLSSHTAPPPP